MKALLALLIAGKMGKILLSGGSMLLLCHEMGHYIAARQSGLTVGLPTFIPFVGAWINLKTQRLNPETAAFVGMAGPPAPAQRSCPRDVSAETFFVRWVANDSETYDIEF